MKTTVRGCQPHQFGETAGVCGSADTADQGLRDAGGGSVRITWLKGSLQEEADSSGAGVQQFHPGGGIALTDALKQAIEICDVAL